MELILETPDKAKTKIAVLPQPEVGQQQLEHDPRPAHAGRAVLWTAFRSRAQLDDARALDTVYGRREESFEDYVNRLHSRSRYRPDSVHDDPLYVAANTPRYSDLSEDVRRRLAAEEPRPPKYEIVGGRVGAVTPGDKLNEKFPPKRAAEYILSLVKD